MRRAILIFTLSLIAVAPAPMPKPYRAQDDLKQMKGRWWRACCAVRPVGDPATVMAETGEIEIEIVGDRMTVTYCGEDRGTYQLRLNASKKPKIIDLQREKGDRVQPGIYSLDGDTLTLCIQTAPGFPRPTDITTVGEGHLREVFKRKNR
jgi:uncharacterized protein (TIGR03067 family)